MSEERDAGAEAGADTFDADFEAARVADEALPAEVGDAPEPEAEAKPEEGQAEDAKPPLSPEELAKRYENQKRATHEERQKRRQEEQTRLRLEARVAELEASRTAPAAERPDPEEDPIGYLKWVEDRLEAAEAAKAQETEQTKAQQERSQEVQGVVTRVQEFENDFRESKPDYDQAAEHLYAAKMAEYHESGYEGEEAHNMVMAEFLTRSRRALSAGKDPAEIVYNLATKAGYGAKAAEAADTKAAEDAKARLAKVAEGQRAASPLGGSGGRGGDELDMADIVHLEGAAFDSAFEKLMGKAKRAGHW